MRPVSAAGSITLSARLEQEPDPLFSLVDPIFQEACGGDIPVLVANAVRFPHACRQLLVVVAELGQHIERRHVVGIVVQDTLQAGDVAN